MAKRNGRLKKRENTGHCDLTDILTKRRKPRKRKKRKKQQKNTVQKRERQEKSRTKVSKKQTKHGTKKTSKQKQGNNQYIINKNREIRQRKKAGNQDIGG